MRIYAGTSGFSYKQWKGPFYPEKLPAKAMLRYYASQLSAVELNNTFYRMPSAETLAAWRAQVPESFRFAVKAPRRITHVKRLQECEEEVGYLLTGLNELGECLGAVLFQLPPYLKVDLPRLDAFASTLPDGLKAAFEFRHASWFHDKVYGALSNRNFALVISETDADEAGVREPRWTADWAYLRLRRADYGEPAIAAWLRRIQDGGLREAQAFFKHEDEGAAPRFAKTMLAMAGTGGLSTPESATAGDPG